MASGWDGVWLRHDQDTRGRLRNSKTVGIRECSRCDDYPPLAARLTHPEGQMFHAPVCQAGARLAVHTPCGPRSQGRWRACHSRYARASERCSAALQMGRTELPPRQTDISLEAGCPRFWAAGSESMQKPGAARLPGEGWSTSVGRSPEIRGKLSSLFPVLSMAKLTAADGMPLPACPVRPVRWQTERCRTAEHRRAGSRR